MNCRGRMTAAMDALIGQLGLAGKLPHVNRDGEGATSPPMDDHVTEFVRASLSSEVPISVLDVGCGSGRLLGRLQTTFGGDVTLFGLDVVDSNVQLDPSFLRRTEERLVTAFPTVPWNDRLTSLASNEPWPYSDGSFDIIVSNQVLEHVSDHARFLAEHARTLKSDGVGIHLFPLKEVIMEWHTGVPLLHRVPPRLGQRLATTWSRLFPTRRVAPRGRVRGESVTTFATRSIEFVQHDTCYVSQSELRRLASTAGLTVEFAGTADLYLNRLRRVLHRPPQIPSFQPMRWRDRIAVRAAKRVSSVVVILRKRE